MFIYKGNNLQFVTKNCIYNIYLQEYTYLVYYNANLIYK